jgi:hypothetical protein
MSESSTIWISAPARCRHLRSKQYYMQQGVHASGMDTGMPVPCWCLKTMKAMGPDEMTASNDDCTPDRSCFEADAG